MHNVARKHLVHTAQRAVDVRVDALGAPRVQLHTHIVAHGLRAAGLGDERREAHVARVCRCIRRGLDLVAREQREHELGRAARRDVCARLALHGAGRRALEPRRECRLAPQRGRRVDERGRRVRGQRKIERIKERRGEVPQLRRIVAVVRRIVLCDARTARARAESNARQAAALRQLAARELDLEEPLGRRRDAHAVERDLRQRRARASVQRAVVRHDAAWPKADAEAARKRERRVAHERRARR